VQSIFRVRVARYSIVVDDDIDPSNNDDVIWALSTRSDPANDIDISRRNWSDPLDPMLTSGDKASERMWNRHAPVEAKSGVCRPAGGVANTQDTNDISNDSVTDDVRIRRHEFTAVGSGHDPATARKMRQTVSGLVQSIREFVCSPRIELLYVGTDRSYLRQGRRRPDN
jgi:3-polyprenyl-4-hydroxybenzoate decarboxylase